MDTSLKLKAFIVTVEVMFFVIPSLTIIGLFLLRNRLGSRCHLLLKASLSVFYAFVTSWLTYTIGVWLEIDGIPLLISISISVMLGLEILYFQLDLLRKRGYKLAEDLLKI